jgi:DNA repair protein RecO
MDKITTELLVLRKTTYKETSIIINGLSPELGLVAFLVKGGKAVSKKKFPVVDLFREIRVEFKNDHRDLHTIYSADLLTNYDSISAYPDNFMEACNLSRFILKNIKPMIESEMLYQSLKTCLTALSQGESHTQWCDLVKLVYMEENGLLPENLTYHQGTEDKQRLLLAKLLDAAIGDGPLPKLTPEYWEQLSQWVGQLCEFNELGNQKYQNSDA